MFHESAVLIQLLILTLSLCRAEDGTTVTTQKPAHTKEATALEVAIVIAGLLAATTMSVVIVLVPTVMYYNYRSKQGLEDAAITLH